jgi:hypothetical protein
MKKEVKSGGTPDYALPVVMGHHLPKHRWHLLSARRYGF